MAIGHRNTELSRWKVNGMKKRAFQFSSSFVSLPTLDLASVGYFAVALLGPSLAYYPSLCVVEECLDMGCTHFDQPGQVLHTQTIAGL